MNSNMRNSNFISILVLTYMHMQLTETTKGATSPEFAVSKRYFNDDTIKLLREVNNFDKMVEKYEPIDLGYGEIDYNPPIILQSALAEAATSDDYSLNQYAPASGRFRLLKAVSALYSKLLNRHLDPNNNVIITVGASEALYSVFQTYTLPNDEWIIIEPYYFVYVPMIKSAGGIPRFIALKPIKTSGKITSADWTFDRKEMSNLFNNKTKGILINSPNNPIGKVFTLEELSFIANLARKWDILVIYDAVYQFLTYDNSKHIELASLSGMFERTITIGSAGKMFGAPGYRIGWAYGASGLINNLRINHIISVYTAPTPNQEAVAIALEKEIAIFGKPHSYLETFKRDIEAKRNYLYKTLSEFGMTPILPKGGYYITANWTTIGDTTTFNTNSEISNAYEFDMWLIKNVKIHGLPISLFYGNDHKHMGEDSLRFTMTKKNETLEKVRRLLRKWKMQ